MKGGMGNMMKQAQELQKKMAEAQEKLSSIEVEGVSGGGVVKVIATAKGEIKRIILDDSVMSKDEKEITEDLFSLTKTLLITEKNAASKAEVNAKITAFKYSGCSL